MRLPGAFHPRARTVVEPGHALGNAVVGNWMVTPDAGSLGR